MAFIPVSPVISSQGRTLKNGVSSLIGELPAPVFSRPEPLKEGRSMDLFWAAKTENSSFLQHILQCPRPGVSSKPRQELLELGGKAKNALAINLARFQYRSSDSVWMVKELHSIFVLFICFLQIPDSQARDTVNMSAFLLHLGYSMDLEPGTEDHMMVDGWASLAALGLMAASSGGIESKLCVEMIT